jgi:hypothetical protein
MSARETAERTAKVLALECRKKGGGRAIKEGKEFAAIGGFDDNGLWFFAVDFATDADRADVREWMRAAA